ncbi:hypothetical protein [Roseivirga sp.]|uniref:hypothetical protein n=1 Tax=Roseivirga sp. TaxID=1964215 RepID=UPI003B8CE42D
MIKSAVRFIITLVFFITCAFTAYSQEKKTELSISTGYATKLSFDQNAVEEGNGFHLGVNLYKRGAERWSWDAQLSINLIAPNPSRDELTINALYGVRYYFNKISSPTRIFFNVLGGVALRNEFADDFTETLIDVGYSGGLFVERKQLLFGLSIDAPQNLIFKVGYRF